MGQVTVFHDADITVTVIDGPPPVDQTALVATLTASLAAMTAERDALIAKIAAAEADLA